MKIKDIFYIVCEICGNSTLAEAVKKLEVKKGDSDIKKMFNCYNLVISELCEEVEPLKFKETLCTNDGKFYYSNFSKVPSRIVKVFANDREIDFQVRPDYVEVGVSKIDVLYEYVPKNAQNLDEQAEYDGILSERVLAYGVASEYLLISGMYQEALMYRDKYERSLVAFKQSQEKKVKARRWV